VKKLVILLTLSILTILSLTTIAYSNKNEVVKKESGISLIQSNTQFVGAGGMSGAISGSGCNIKVAQY
jgi:hypothetical protein